jgi:hypothetical protein
MPYCELGFRPIQEMRAFFDLLVDSIIALGAVDQGCQIFLGTKYQNGGKYIKRP